MMQLLQLFTSRHVACISSMIQLLPTDWKKLRQREWKGKPNLYHLPSSLWSPIHCRHISSVYPSPPLFGLWSQIPCSHIVVLLLLHHITLRSIKHIKWCYAICPVLYRIKIVFKYITNVFHSFSSLQGGNYRNSTSVMSRRCVDTIEGVWGAYALVCRRSMDL